LAQRAEAVLHYWDDEQHAVFFEPSSGDTHQVSALAVFLADALEAGPLGLDALFSAVGETLETQVDEDPRELLRRHLDRLVSLGLLQELTA
jgi:PqqD family protein of HPr-rel-A system